MIYLTEKRASGEGQVAGNGNRFVTDQHPAWCSAERCFVTDDGVRVHEQAPVRWEDETSAVRIETRLIDPADGLNVYVELCATSPRFKGSSVYAIMPTAAARRLRDQLTAHLDAVE